MSTLTKKFSFTGNGGSFLLLFLKSFLLTVLTLGLYIPWLIVDFKKFYYNNSYLDQKKFEFQGKGIDYLLRFLIGFLTIISFYGLIFYLIFNGKIELLSIVMPVFFLGLIASLPFAIFNGYKYEMEKLTFNNKNFTFEGDLKEFLSLSIPALLLTLLTFGFGIFWFAAKVSNYLTEKTKLGNVSFKSDFDGLSLLLSFLKNMFLIIVTLFIYIFWAIENDYKEQLAAIKIKQNENSGVLTTNVKGSKFLGLFFKHIFLTFLTFGFFYFWGVVETMKYVMDETSLEGNIDLDNLD